MSGGGGSSRRGGGSEFFFGNGGGGSSRGGGGREIFLGSGGGGSNEDSDFLKSLTPDELRAWRDMLDRNGPLPSEDELNKTSKSMLTCLGFVGLGVVNALLLNAGPIGMGAAAILDSGVAGGLWLDLRKRKTIKNQVLIDKTQLKMHRNEDDASKTGFRE